MSNNQRGRKGPNNQAQRTGSPNLPGASPVRTVQIGRHGLYIPEGHLSDRVNRLALRDAKIDEIRRKARREGGADRKKMFGRWAGSLQIEFEKQRGELVTAGRR